MSEKLIKSYKAFDKNMQCRGLQYEVGKEYEIDGEIKCCDRGFHACKSPMEVWDHYDMLSSRFAEVEQSGKIDEEGNSTKVCSSHIKIKAELKLADIIKVGVEWLKDITSPSKFKTADGVLNDKGEINKQIGSSGDYAQIGSSGYSTQIGSSGDSTQIGSSGDYAHIGSSGDSAQIGSSGDYAQIGSSGDSAKIGSSGDYAQIGSSGDYAQIGSSGGSAKIGSSGDSAQIGSSGDYAQIGSSGDYAQIGSSGDSAKIGSSGDSAKINSTGEDSVIMCAGNNSRAKAKAGSWITLSEWKWSDEKNCNVPICVKTEYVDGENIKADTWYQLKNGEFVEVTNHPLWDINISNMIKKYRKKPVTIDAIQWDGKNLSEIDNFMGGTVENKGTTIVIHTLEGDMEASIGDYIIKGVNGEFYPCKPDIFAKTYEEVTE